MRESCSCGAACQSIRAKNVREWRYTHHCPDRPEPVEPEPQKEGSFSSTERRPQYDHDSPLSIIGFTLESVPPYPVPTTPFRDALSIDR